MQKECMIYGYARVSTDGQDLTDQLGAAGCEKVFREKIAKHQKREARARMGAGETLCSVACSSSNVSQATIPRLAV